MAGAEERAEALTRCAYEAAQGGRWEEVLRCYRERAVTVGEAEVCPSLARRLSAIDQEIEGLVRVARDALTASILDTVGLRVRLRRLRERFGTNDPTGRFANRCI